MYKAKITLYIATTQLSWKEEVSKPGWALPFQYFQFKYWSNNLRTAEHPDPARLMREEIVVPGRFAAVAMTQVGQSACLVAFP